MSQSFRNARATELRRLAQILQREGVINDAGPLYSAEVECRKDKGSNWGYSLEGLIFRPLSQLKTIPYPIEELSLRLTIDVKGICNDQIEGDPFEDYNLQLLIRGSYKNQLDDSYKVVTCSWHLDRHISNPGDGDSRFLHPHYHLQFGGHALKEVVGDDQQFVGKILLIDSPRIAYPPLDALLGIDFVLTNFFTSPDLKFREEGEYANQLEAMQERLWKSYTKALASRWQPNHHLAPWQCNLIWPQLTV